MKRVKFIAMKEGTQEDFEIINENDAQTNSELPDRIIEHLEKMSEDDGAYHIDRLQHVLQCATRAYRDNANDQWIVAALLHDIGDTLAPYTHGPVAAEILKPFVSEEIEWVVRHHGYFQMRYNRSLTREQRDTYLKFKEHPFFDAAMKFTEGWDQNSFDPDYDTLDLEFFKPLIRKIFSKPWS